jgi:hypothetical protein
MLTVEQIETIRRAYSHEHKSVRAIARELGHGRRVVREAIAGDERHDIEVLGLEPGVYVLSAALDERAAEIQHSTTHLLEAA